MAKKRKKNAIPKRIGGVKVPKTVRRGVRQFIGTQSGQVLAAEVMTALGAALAASQLKRGSAVRGELAKGRPGATGLDLAGAAASTATALKFAIGEATRTFNEALHNGKAEADARAAWPETDESVPEKKPVGGKTAQPPTH